VNSFVAKEAGLYGPADQNDFTVGVKETLALPKDVIDERFGVRDRDGVDIEILGGTAGVPGGAFVYTNLETLSVGVVLKLPALAAQSRRPEEIIAGLKAHPAIAPLVDGAELKEFSAHVIPEGGYRMIPTLTGDGLLVAGDAAALCAIAAGDTSAAGLRGYRTALERSFVLEDHRRLRDVPHLVLSDRVQHQYPGFVCNVAERMFRIDNPTPKPGLRRIVRQEAKRAGVRLRDLAKDAWTAVRGFG
jgi:electron transfer flavoprotein-quinone oxidoreductase